jgi:hypothetical protein
MTNRKISPLWLGIIISGSLLVIFLVTETILGRWAQIPTAGGFDALASSSGVLRDIRLAIVHCLVMGYLAAALLYAVTSARRTVLMLQDALSCTRQECEVLSTSVKLSKSGLAIIGVIGLLLSFAAPYMTPPIPPELWNPLTWSPEVAWHRVLGPLTMVFAWWLGYAIVSVSVRLSRIAKKLKNIDLFDTSALTPFTQQGLTNALLLIGSFSIWSLMLIETGFKEMLWIVGGTTLLTTIVALLSPVYGVHLRIRQAKLEALTWVDTEISDYQTSFQNRDNDRRSGEMADLIAYRGLVDDVPEWPFTSFTYIRIALYTLLPFLTWSIGLVAEEILSRLLP